MRIVIGMFGLVALGMPFLLGAPADQGPARKETAPLDVLVVAPHPDDEALGCAGVILQAIANKQPVGVVLVTNGDGFPKAAAVVAKKTEAQLEAADFVRLAGIRQQHSVGALTRIGVRPADLMALGYPDSGLKALYEAKAETPFKQRFTGGEERGQPELFWTNSRSGIFRQHQALRRLANFLPSFPPSAFRFSSQGQ
jgi:LmbE family N-acetylglucosaminyl deacetylase